MEQVAKVCKISNTTIYIMDPSNRTQEEIEKILTEYCKIGWEIWQECLKVKESN